MNKLEIGEQKKKALIILVGPPASGKSTWGKKFAADNQVEYVSTDEIRGQIGAGEGDQSVSAAATAVQPLTPGRRALQPVPQVTRQQIVRAPYSRSDRRRC